MRRSCLSLSLSLTGAAMLAVGCDANLPGKPDPKDRPVPADQVLAFNVLFGRNCAGCHGADGKQGPAPPLNDPLFRAIIPKAELEMVLSEGREGTPMAPFEHANGGPLTAQQVQVLIHEIKGVRYRIEKGKVVADEQGTTPAWGAVAAAPGSPPPYTLPQEAGKVEPGGKIFARACASCHGTNGEGLERDGKRRNQINDSMFLSLISDQELRRIIITGRPDLKMPNYEKKAERADDFQPLTSAEIADLGALLSSWRKGKSVAAK